jgi:hypothetical protein
VSRSKERTIKLVKMAVGALALAGALSLGSVQANAASASMETESRHWANSVECETEQNARLN